MFHVEHFDSPHDADTALHHSDNGAHTLGLAADDRGADGLRATSDHRDSSFAGRRLAAAKTVDACR